jgi:DNA mismatch endonuclease (patch repair protein)
MIAGCQDARRPKSNTDYWNSKLARNKERDTERIAALKRMGWKVLTVWECETTDAAALKRRLLNFLRG